MTLDQLKAFLDQCDDQGVQFSRENMLTFALSDFFEVIPEEKQIMPDLEYNHRSALNNMIVVYIVPDNSIPKR